MGQKDFPYRSCTTRPKPSSCSRSCMIYLNLIMDVWESSQVHSTCRGSLLVLCDIWVLKWMMCTHHYSVSYRMFPNFPQSFHSMPIHLNPNIQSFCYPSAFPLLDYHTVGSIQHSAFRLPSFSQESAFAFPPKLICNLVTFLLLLLYCSTSHCVNVPCFIFLMTQKIN